jgi:DNA-binding MarR family transcriptional regulator
MSDAKKGNDDETINSTGIDAGSDQTVLRVFPEPEAPGTENSSFVISDNVGHVAVVTARLFDRELAGRLREHGIPIGQWPFLMFLWADASLSQRTLSRLMAVEPSTVTNTIERMIRDGLVVKERAEDDLRTNRLRLTDRALALRDILLPEARAVVEAATSGMSQDEVRFLVSLLKKLQKNLLTEKNHPLLRDR